MIYAFLKLRSVRLFFQIDDAQDEDVITYLFDAPTPEGIFCLNVDKADEKCDKAVKVSM